MLMPMAHLAPQRQAVKLLASDLPTPAAHLAHWGDSPYSQEQPKRAIEKKEGHRTDELNNGQ